MNEFENIDKVFAYKSEELNRKSQIPQGQALKYHGFIICKVFQNDRIDEIQDLLDYFFQGLHSHSWFVWDYKSFLERTLLPFYGSSWQNVGSIRSKKFYKEEDLFPERVFDLPDGLKTLHFSIGHPVPSLVCLVITASLTEKVSKELEKIFNKEYKKIEKLHGSIEEYRLHLPNELKKEAVYKFTSAIVEKVEEFISLNTKVSIQEKPYSVIQVYSLKEIPLDDRLKNWIKEKRLFLNALGFKQGLVFQGENYLFSPSSKKANWEILASRNLLESSEEYISHYEKKFLNICQYLAINDFMENKMGYFTEIRSKVKKISSKLKFEQFAPQYEEFLNAQYFSDLVAREVNLLVKDLPENFELKSIEQGDKTFHNDFFNKIRETLEFQSQTLKREIEMLRERYNNVFRQIESVTQHRLTKWLFWLTVFLVIFTLIMAIPAIKELIKLISKIF